MIAYKFLAPGAVGRFSRFSWPTATGEPGSWVEAERAELCASGIHACRLDDLPYWLDDELWQIELGGEVISGHDTVVAPRARLLAPIRAWSNVVAHDFGRACADRAHQLAVESERARSPHALAVADAAATCREHAEVRPTEPAFVTWMAFTGFGLRRIGDLCEGDDGRAAARRQAAWLADRLGLI